MKELARSQGGFSLDHMTGRIMFLQFSLKERGVYGRRIVVHILANK